RRQPLISLDDRGYREAQRFGLGAYGRKARPGRVGARGDPGLDSLHDRFYACRALSHGGDFLAAMCCIAGVCITVSENCTVLCMAWRASSMVNCMQAAR